MEKYIMQTKFNSSLIQFSREVWSEQPLLEYNSWLKNASSNAFIPIDIFIDFFKGFDVTYKEGTALLMCTNYMMVSWYSLRLTASFLLTFILKFTHRFSKNTYKLLNPHTCIFSHGCATHPQALPHRQLCGSDQILTSELLFQLPP